MPANLINLRLVGKVFSSFKLEHCDVSAILFRGFYVVDFAVQIQQKKLVLVLIFASFINICVCICICICACVRICICACVCICSECDLKAPHKISGFQSVRYHISICIPVHCSVSVYQFFFCISVY